MKSILSKTLVLGAVLLSLGTAQAGIEMFDSNEFNSIINDSLQAEKDLREELRANAGVPDLKKELHPDFSEAGRRLVGTVEAENVASPSSDYSRKGIDKSRKKLMERNLKRVSQEIRDIELTQ